MPVKKSTVHVLLDIIQRRDIDSIHCIKMAVTMNPYPCGYYHTFLYSFFENVRMIMSPEEGENEGG